MGPKLLVCPKLLLGFNELDPQAESLPDGSWPVVRAWTSVSVIKCCACVSPCFAMLKRICKKAGYSSSPRSLHKRTIKRTRSSLDVRDRHPLAKDWAAPNQLGLAFSAKDISVVKCWRGRQYGQESAPIYRWVTHREQTPGML